MLAKTHAAVSVALESVAKRRAQLLGLGGQTTLLAPLAQLKIVKVCNDAGDDVPEGCGRVLPDGGEEQSALAQWETLLTEPLLVVGRTPGTRV